MAKKLFAAMLTLLFVLAVGCGEDIKSNVSKTTATTSGQETSATETPSTSAGQSTTQAVTTNGSGSPDIQSGDVQGEVTSGVRKIYITTAKATIGVKLPPVAVNEKTVGNTMVSPITGLKYQLKFIDDFTGTSLNTSRWNIAYNHYAQEKMTADSVAVKDNNLVITAKKTGNTITSGIINSSGKVAYKYGRIEAYMKMPYSTGMWPAFWTVGQDKNWPWGGEIDIIELVGGSGRDGQYNSTIHWCSPDTPNDDKAYLSVEQGGAHQARGVGVYNLANYNISGKMHDAYHVYGVEWTDQKMYFYLDGNMFGSTNITDPSMKYAFHTKHYMIFDLAVGGSWAGTPNSSTVWPSELRADWVKVWQIAK